MKYETIKKMNENLTHMVMAGLCAFRQLCFRIHFFSPLAKQRTLPQTANAHSLVIIRNFTKTTKPTKEPFKIVNLPNYQIKTS
jgi:hypothetical protein